MPLVGRAAATPRRTAPSPSQLTFAYPLKAVSKKAFPAHSLSSLASPVPVCPDTLPSQALGPADGACCPAHAGQLSAAPVLGPVTTVSASWPGLLRTAAARPTAASPIPLSLPFFPAHHCPCLSPTRGPPAARRGPLTQTCLKLRLLRFPPRCLLALSLSPYLLARRSILLLTRRSRPPREMTALRQVMIDPITPVCTRATPRATLTRCTFCVRHADICAIPDRGRLDGGKWEASLRSFWLQSACNLYAPKG